jgi:hypothetical protein
MAIVVEVKGDTKNLDNALGKSADSVKGFGGSLGGVVPVAALATAGIAAAGVAAIGLANAAAEDRAEQQKLEQAIRAAGAAHGDYALQVDAAIAAGQELAFTDSETRVAMQNLVTATGDVTKATELMGLAQDVARLSGVSLEDASKAVAKAQAGQDGALRKLIPGLEKGKSATDTLASASKLAAGQADLYAKSSEGMATKGMDAFSEIGETIGSAFLPILDEVLPALIPVIKAFGTLIEAILPVIIPLIKVLASVLGFVANALSTVVNWLSSLIRWLSNAAAAVGRFLDSINPLKGISLPSLPFLSSAPAGASASAASRGAMRSSGAAGGGGITINIVGDPAIIERTVIRALRQYGRRNAFGEPVTAI